MVCTITSYEFLMHEVDFNHVIINNKQCPSSFPITGLMVKDVCWQQEIYIVRPHGWGCLLTIRNLHCQWMINPNNHHNKIYWIYQNKLLLTTTKKIAVLNWEGLNTGEIRRLPHRLSHINHLYEKLKYVRTN